MRKLKVLVFDDTKLHLDAAQYQLGENYELTTVSTYESAEKALSEMNFDILLTDLMVPPSEHMLTDPGEFKGKIMPLGTFIVLLGLKIGIKKIGIITNTNHHKHPASSALDIFGGYHGIPFTIGDARMVFASNFLTRTDWFNNSEPWKKDWIRAIDILTDKDS